MHKDFEENDTFKYLGKNDESKDVNEEGRLNSGNDNVLQLIVYGLVSCLKTNKQGNKPIILPVVSCGCETLLFALREGHELTAFANEELRKILEPMRDEIIGG